MLINSQVRCPRMKRVRFCASRPRQQKIARACAVFERQSGSHRLYSAAHAPKRAKNLPPRRLPRNPALFSEYIPLPRRSAAVFFSAPPAFSVCTSGMLSFRRAIRWGTSAMALVPVFLKVSASGLDSTVSGRFPLEQQELATAHEGHLRLSAATVSGASGI